MHPDGIGEERSGCRTKCQSHVLLSLVLRIGLILSRFIMPRSVLPQNE